MSAFAYGLWSVFWALCVILGGLMLAGLLGWLWELVLRIAMRL